MIQISKLSLSPQIYSLTEENILILDLNASYDDTEAVLAQLNSAQNVDSRYWFRMLNVQPKEAPSRSLPSQSLLFLSSFSIQDKTFVGKTEAGQIVKYIEHLDAAESQHFIQ